MQATPMATRQKQCGKCHPTHHKPHGHRGRHIKTKKKPQKNSSDKRTSKNQGGRPTKRPTCPTPTSNTTGHRKSLARAAKTAEKATHEVAKTNASDPHPSSFHGQYEPCSIVSDDGLTYTVKIQDGNGGVTINGVPKRFVRPLRFADTQDYIPSRANNRQAKGQRHTYKSVNSTNRRFNTGGNIKMTTKWNFHTNPYYFQ